MTKQTDDYAGPIEGPTMDRITVSFWNDEAVAIAVMSIEADERGTFPALSWPAGVTRWRIEGVNYR